MSGLKTSDYVFLAINGGDRLCEVATLPDGSAGLVMRGTAGIEERRQLFRILYQGCEKVAEDIEKGHYSDATPKTEIK